MMRLIDDCQKRMSYLGLWEESSALYRDGSKLSQPLAAALLDDDDDAAEVMEEGNPQRGQQLWRRK